MKQKTSNQGLVLRDLRRIFSDPELKGLLFFAVIIIAVGIVFYMAVEGWDFVEALYFCVTTLTTVGFGDLAPTSDLSRLFTVAYTLIGIGFILSMLTVVARQANKPIVERLKRNEEK